MKQNITDFLRVLKKFQKINPEFPLQYIVCLSYIALDESLSMTDLADRTGMALSTVSRIVTALSRANGAYELIRVEIAPDEKRRKRIFLTEKGKTLIQNIGDVNINHIHDCTTQKTVL